MKANMYGAGTFSEYGIQLIRIEPSFHSYNWMRRGFFFMANNWVGRVKKAFAERMDLPQDILLELPRITMVGQIHIYIENHRGILTFSETELRLALKQGYLLVKGNHFVLKTILVEEILLEGEIEQVLFVNEESK